jgi:hypothetical protein
MYHQHNPTLAVGNQKISGKCLFCPERAVWLGIFTWGGKKAVYYGLCKAHDPQQEGVPEKAERLILETLRESAEICFICDAEPYAIVSLPGKSAKVALCLNHAQQVEQVHPLMQAYFSGKK